MAAVESDGEIHCPPVEWQSDAVWGNGRVVALTLLRPSRCCSRKITVVPA
jgi:hypothetical protein